MDGRVVVGVDGSEGGDRALRWAAASARAREALLEPIAVWQTPYDFGEVPLVPVDEEPLAVATRQMLDAAVAGVADMTAGVKVESRVLHGDPGQELCDHARDAAALVVGSRGRGAFAGLMLGSVSTTCAHHARCPVVIVPPPERQAPPRDPARVERVVVGVDGSPASTRALRWAIEEAAARHASVEALAVWTNPYDGGMVLEFQTAPFRRDRQAALDRLAEVLEATVAEARGEAPSVTVDATVVEGNPADVLCHRAAAADLLVIGRRGHHRVSRWLLGSVGNACAHHARSPIVIVPEADRGHADAPPADTPTAG